MKISNKAKYNMLYDDIADAIGNIKIECNNGYIARFSTKEEAYIFCEANNLNLTEWAIFEC